MSELKRGDLVKLKQVPGALGEVLRVESDHVLVEWEDGTHGLLYYDIKMIPNVRNLTIVGGRP